MDNFNLDELMDLAEAYVGPMVDAIYRRLIERDFALEDPEVVMLLTALINILGHDNRGDRPTEVLLMAAYGERGVLDRPNMRVMRWRNGALSGSDLANEPGLGSSRNYQPGEMPMPSKPKPGLTRMHREMNSEATSSGSPLRAAVPPKGAKVTQKVQTNQTIQDLDEMNIRHSETYCRPSGARYLVGSTLAPMCKSRYPVHFVAVDVKSTRTIVDQAFSVPKCVRLARMSEKSYELLCKMFSAVPERTKEELESILGKKFMGYVSGNFSDFERQKQRGSTVTDYNAVDENDEIHRVMMEVEPLLEASGKRNWRSIMLTHDEFPCHCLLQTWWYPKRSNLVLIWDSGELLSMGLPDSSQPITIVIVGVMMAIRWLEAHVRENNRQEAPTREQLQKLDCLKDLDLFETMCKVLNIPMEVKKIWARKRLMPWFRANMTAWLYEYAKKHMSKHGRVYSEYQLDIGAGAFKRAFVTHRNAVTTAVKRISRTSERSGNEKTEMLKEDLERNVTLCLHNSFCRNRESNVDPLPCCKQRVEEQKCWRTASNSVRIVNDVLQDTETESAESASQEEEMEH